MKVNFTSIKRYSKILTHDIGVKARKYFSNDPTATPYPVVFTDPASARSRGLPPTGWIDYGEQQITIVVDETMDPKKAWTLAKHTDVHEHLHWARDVAPYQLGVKTDPEATTLNIFLDANNEQYGLLTCEWAKRLLVAGRKIRQADYLAIPQARRHDPEPLYAAGYLVLAAHTTLMTRGKRVLGRIHSGKPLDSTTLDRLWKEISKVVGACPANIANEWMKAFEIAVNAWRLCDRQEIFSLVHEFMALFPAPKPNYIPIYCPLDVGGHVGRSRKDVPPGLGLPPSIVVAVPDDDDLGLDPEEAESGEDEESDQVRQDVENASRPADKWHRGAPPGGSSDQIYPVDPTSLIGRAIPLAAELRENLRLVQEGGVLEYGVRGRVDSAIVGREPDHASPFIATVLEEETLGPGVAILTLVDTSGSMDSDVKWPPVNLALMASHLAMQEANAPHFIATSRTLRLLAAPDMSPDRAQALIAGAKPHPRDGDNFGLTLGLAIRQFLQWDPAQLNLAFSKHLDPQHSFVPRDEYIRVVVVIHDGCPCDRDAFKEHVRVGRQRGLIVVGLGLELDSGDQAGMRDLFGPHDLVLATGQDFARKLGSTITAAVERGRRIL